MLEGDKAGMVRSGGRGFLGGGVWAVPCMRPQSGYGGVTQGGEPSRAGREGGGRRSNKGTGRGDGESRTLAGAKESSRPGLDAGSAKAEAGVAPPSGRTAGAGGAGGAVLAGAPGGEAEGAGPR